MPVYKRREPRLKAHPREVTPYQISFIRDVHLLLSKGFLRMHGDLAGDIDEPMLTGLLAEAVTHYLESDGCPQRLTAYHVDDEISINDRALSKGKQRPRIDLVFTRTGRGKRPRFHFEAKRLRSGKSLTDYLGEDGLGCFLSGKYAREEGHAGMLGYVESDSPPKWAERLRHALLEHASALRNDDFWKQQMASNLDHCYLTKHERPSTGRHIDIYHTLLDMRRTQVASSVE